MEAGEIVSCWLAVASILVTLVFSFLLTTYLASIPHMKRNLATMLDNLLFLVLPVPVIAEVRPDT